VSLLSPRAAPAQIPDPGLRLPRMEQCQGNSHPMLPQKWRGVYLMMPFTPTQLVLSEIVYDGTLPAMLVRLYGVRSGAAELLVVGKKTYLLAGGEGGHFLGMDGRPLVPLSPHLLAAD